MARPAENRKWGLGYAGKDQTDVRVRSEQKMAMDQMGPSLFLFMKPDSAARPKLCAMDTCPELAIDSKMVSEEPKSFGRHSCHAFATGRFHQSRSPELKACAIVAYEPQEIPPSCN